MNARAVLWIGVCAAALAAGQAGAQGPPAECEAEPPEGHPLADREAAMSVYERMPESCLKALFVGCSDAAGRQLLDMGSAAMCSMGYEALLKRGFGGDFHALLGWWRIQRSSTVRE